MTISATITRTHLIWTIVLLALLCGDVWINYLIGSDPDSRAYLGMGMSLIGLAYLPVAAITQGFAIYFGDRRWSWLTVWSPTWTYPLMIPILLFLTAICL